MPWQLSIAQSLEIMNPRLKQFCSRFALHLKTGPSFNFVSRYFLVLSAWLEWRQDC
jgi:hypothetical protein